MVNKHSEITKLFSTQFKIWWTNNYPSIKVYVEETPSYNVNNGVWIHYSTNIRDISKTTIGRVNGDSTVRSDGYFQVNINYPEKSNINDMNEIVDSLINHFNFKQFITNLGIQIDVDKSDNVKSQIDATIIRTVRFIFRAYSIE